MKEASENAKGCLPVATSARECSQVPGGLEKSDNQHSSSTPSARGSVLLQNRQDRAEVMTIARWDRFEDWQTFWKGAPQDDMEFMQNLAELLSSQAFDELRDHTI